MRKGYLLLEFLCALVLGGMVLVCSGIFCTSFIRWNHRIQNSCFELFSLVRAASFIDDFFREGPCDAAQWMHPARGEIAWQQGKEKRTLVLKGQRLILKTKNKEKRESSKLLMDGVTRMECKPFPADHPFQKGCELDLATGHLSVSVFFRCLNGRLISLKGT